MSLLPERLMNPKGHPRYPQITRPLRDRVRRDYFRKCECCGRRPTMRQLAERYGVSPESVWRMVNP